jgi:hypothetical protein
LKGFEHVNVVPFLGVLEEPDSLLIISPWYKQGDILNYLNSHEANRFLLVGNFSIA